MVDVVKGWALAWSMYWRGEGSHGRCIGIRWLDDDIDEGDWIGANVRKNFEGYGVFDGKVIGSTKVKNRYIYKVRYSDGDIDEYEEEELLEILVQ